MIKFATAFFTFAVIGSLTLFSPGQAEAATIIVPTQVSSIQSAILASQNGDTVLVERGTYMENINFRGRAIIVASRYLLTHDPADIAATIINGSAPIHPDTASCVIFGNHEDTSSVLEGFTLTGGTGTVWQDIHNHLFYREGGGVLSDLASPTIRNNYIIGNSATNKTGVSSSGGGGIRCGDGNPRILNNVIMENAGRYGGGIVLNYSGALIRNNVVYRNTGGEDYGGAGIWCTSNGPAQKIVENNTILDNVSVLDGGGVSISGTSMLLRNNIIWGNVAPAFAQIDPGGINLSVSYSDVQGGFTGTGNIAAKPQFNDSGATLLGTSPCIDGGNAAATYNDRTDTLNPGFAMLPSRGTIRNDMGAYGGQGAMPNVLFSIHLNAPTRPTAVSAYSDYRFPGKILLAWHDPDTTVSGGTLTNFVIRIYKNGGVLADVAPGVQAYEDTTVALHQLNKYSFRTIAFGDSSAADSASAYAGGSAFPAAPKNFSVTDAQDGLRLQWTNPSRQSDGTPLNDLATLYLFRDGALLDSIAQSSADSGQSRSYFDTIPGFHYYRLTAADNENPTHSSAFTDSILGSAGFVTGYTDGFEGGMGAFFKTRAWDSTSAIAHEGSRSITDSPVGNTMTRSESFVLSPNIIVPARGIFSYYTIAIARTGTICFTEISINHRKTYSLLHAFNASSHAEWQDGTADPGDWFEDRFDLAPYAGDTITIRFRIASITDLTNDGWYIDAFNVYSEPLQTVSRTLAAGWNMVSLPVKVDDHTASGIFPWAQGNMYSYAGGYQRYDSVEHGRGYWIKAPASQNYEAIGTTIRADTIRVTAGWNMIGSISSPVDTASVSTIPGGLRKTSFFGYDSAYSAAPSLEPGKAYWVKMSAAGRMVLTAPPTGSAKPSATLSDRRKQ